MVFVSNVMRHALPPDLADHLAKNWKLPTPYEPRIAVIDEIAGDGSIYYILEGAGNWFVGNLPESAKLI